MKDRKTVEREILNPPAHLLGGTVGDDVLTVHTLRDGRPFCGTSGDVVVWQRRVTCKACVASGQVPGPPDQ
ncbi:hypothetical protein H3146_04930 [Streptomyces sp. OF3]|uniref:Uncharacterized protein n=1 Tax=Streptomyces alkaliterrae TaxID=2213162 RepID=A0A7W3WI43_9ACTN|nr:hypothetical protein [Streptomyces alkaliterrae]MBB1252713.1 hypothetical protein [Streptomyces alkaliterrae]